MFVIRVHTEVGKERTRLIIFGEIPSAYVELIEACCGQAIRDAGDNIPGTLSSVNEATANMAEDTEALKLGFLFRGFFKRRGYYSIAHLVPAQYRKNKTFGNPTNPPVSIEAGELFEPRGEGEALSEAGKARIDAAIGEFGERAIGVAIAVEGYAITEGSGDEPGLSRSRATLVQNYLEARFQHSSQNIGTVPLRGVPPLAKHMRSWNGICHVLLSYAC